MTEQLKIRATSTLKLIAKDGATLTYQYPKQCSVDEIATDALFAVFLNKGAEGCQEFFDACIDKFKKHNQ